MNYKETIEKIAKRSLNDQELADFTRDQWGLIASWIKENQDEPNGNKYWLKQHQITAFWHGFGISNGLTFVTKDLETKGKYTTVPAKIMQYHLKEYIKWLKSYKESWNIREDHPHGIDTREKFLEDEQGSHESRADVLEMIELLQECRIND